MPVVRHQNGAPKRTTGAKIESQIPLAPEWSPKTDHRYQNGALKPTTGTKTEPPKNGPPPKWTPKMESPKWNPKTDDQRVLGLDFGAGGPFWGSIVVPVVRFWCSVLVPVVRFGARFWFRVGFGARFWFRWSVLGLHFGAGGPFWGSILVPVARFGAPLWHRWSGFGVPFWGR